LWKATPVRAAREVKVPVCAPAAARNDRDEAFPSRKVLFSPVSAKYDHPLPVREEDTPRGESPAPARAVKEVLPLLNDFPAERDEKETNRSGVLGVKDTVIDGLREKETELLPSDRSAGITADDPHTDSEDDATCRSLFCTVPQIADGTPRPNSLSTPGSPMSTAHSLRTPKTSSAVSQSWDR